MKRYFFDFEHGQKPRDDEGIELPDQHNARLEAVKLLGQELCDKSASFWDAPEISLVVRDHADFVLMRLTVFGSLAPAAR